jgi:dTDP-4-amino-4,6-dideoxygalactose transaminase
MLRFVPPAGFPLRIRQILRAFVCSFGARRRADENLTTIAERLRSKYVFGVSSGRAALAIVLGGLRRLRSDRTIVVLPAYTCFTVAASIVRSNLQLYPVDIDHETMDFEFSQLEAVPQEGVLCILTSNLFGMVNDLTRIREIAQAKGVFVVDDAAQAFGATRNGNSSGTGGDVGIYSLGRGKALPAIEGGLIVTNSDEIAGALQAELGLVPKASWAHEAWVFFQMLVYSILLHPRLYWFPNAMPFLKLGVTEFSPGFRIAGLPGLSSALLMQLLEEGVDANQVRRANAAILSKALGASSSFSTPVPAADCLPTYIRYPVIARDQARRDQAVKMLRAAGIGAGPLYPTAVCDIPGIGRYMATRNYHRPEAEYLSQKLFTLPTHHYVAGRDLDRVISVLNSI